MLLRRKAFLYFGKVLMDINTGLVSQSAIKENSIT